MIDLLIKHTMTELEIQRVLDEYCQLNPEPEPEQWSATLKKRTGRHSGT